MEIKVLAVGMPQRFKLGVTRDLSSRLQYNRILEGCDGLSVRGVFEHPRSPGVGKFSGMSWEFTWSHGVACSRIDRGSNFGIAIIGDLKIMKQEVLGRPKALDRIEEEVYIKRHFRRQEAHFSHKVSLRSWIGGRLELKTEDQSEMSLETAVVARERSKCFTSQLENNGGEMLHGDKEIVEEFICGRVKRWLKFKLLNLIGLICRIVDIRGTNQTRKIESVGGWLVCPIKAQTNGRLEFGIRSALSRKTMEDFTGRHETNLASTTGSRKQHIVTRGLSNAVDVIGIKVND
ncbi:hypothetical protein SDJN02_15068, partial [Cucurbita argyrosperma subsp. argyrosperma]